MNRPFRKATVLLADDHRITVEGLARILEPVHQIVGTVHDGRALVEAAVRLKPEVVVADVAMPELNGIEAMRRIKQLLPRAKVIILTGFSDKALARRALRFGASGYVLKASAGEQLLEAVDAVIEGRIYVAADVADEGLPKLLESASGAENSIERLTAREREVLQLIAEGKSIKETGAVLDVSPRTVEFHKANLQDKIGLGTIAELARYAAKHRLVAE